MPVLPKNRHELFAQGLAKGLGIGAAYEAAGYKPSPAAATRLSKNVKLQERVAELQGVSAERATVTRQWMLERLKENVERCMTEMAVLDREEKPTEKYGYQGNLAHKALELIGCRAAELAIAVILSASGKAAEGLPRARHAVAEYANVPRQQSLHSLAICCEGAGEIDEALQLLDREFEVANATGERFYEAELHRLKGEWLLAHRPARSAEAEDCYTK